MGVDHRLLRISSKDSRFMAVTQVRAGLLQAAQMMRV
jgi:hypothetical protein